MISLISFSPTYTGLTVAKKVLEGMGLEFKNVQHIDLCKPEIRNNPPNIEGNGVIFVFPCYEGHVPPIVRQTLQKINGRNLPAVAMIVYGNRVIGVALKELVRLLNLSEFRVIGTGTFIGQHSYADTEKLPMALGRPDAEDLATAFEFGKSLAKINWTSVESKGFMAADIKGSIKFLFRLVPEGFLGSFVKPGSIDQNKCTDCGKCARECPMGAINPENKKYVVNKKKCIHCMRCVRFCPENARPMRYTLLVFIKMFMKPAIVSRKNARFMIVEV